MILGFFEILSSNARAHCQIDQTINQLQQYIFFFVAFGLRRLTHHAKLIRKYSTFRDAVPAFVRAAHDAAIAAQQGGGPVVPKLPAELAKELMDACRNSVVPLTTEDVFTNKANTLCASECYMKLVSFLKANPPQLPINMRPAFSQTVSNAFVPLSTLSSDRFEELFGIVFQHVDATFPRGAVDVVLDIAEILNKLGHIPHVLKELVPDATSVEQLVMIRANLVLEVLSSMQYMPAMTTRKLSWDTVGPHVCLLKNAIKAVGLADCTCDENDLVDMWSNMFRALKAQADSSNPPDVAAVMAQICGARQLNQIQDMSAEPARPAEPPAPVATAALTAPKDPVEEATESADLATVPPQYRTELNVNEMGWFFDEDRSKTRKRLAHSPDAISADFQPGLPDLKQLCLAMHAQFNLMQCCKAYWPDSLQINVAAGPAKKMGVSLKPGWSVDDLPNISMNLAGPVGLIANDKSYVCATVYGVPFYVGGSSCTQFTSDCFAPAWLVKVDDKKANLMYVESFHKMYHVIISSPAHTII